MTISSITRSAKFIETSNGKPAALTSSYNNPEPRYNPICFCENARPTVRTALRVVEGNPEEENTSSSSFSE